MMYIEFNQFIEQEVQKNFLLEFIIGDGFFFLFGDDVLDNFVELVLVLRGDSDWFEIGNIGQVECLIKEFDVNFELEFDMDQVEC